jgi:hypothetical protein
MRTKTLVLVLILVAALVSTAFAMRGEGGRRLHHWIAQMHGGH